MTDPGFGARCPRCAQLVAIRPDGQLCAHFRPGHADPCLPEMDMSDLEREIDRLTEPSLASRLDRSRPYDGQPHTDLGERGKTEVRGLTMRDVTDCFVRACYDASGLSPEEWPGDIYQLPWDDMDPIAVSQNLTCWIERYMGIFPNAPHIEVVVP